MKESTRQKASDLIREHGDICAAYAAVCNQLVEAHSDETLLDVKICLMHRMACDRMEEFGWSQTDGGCWVLEDNAAYWERLRKEGLCNGNK